MQALPIILYRALEERIFFIGHGFIIRESGKREMLEKKPLKELLQKEGNISLKSNESKTYEVELTFNSNKGES